MEEWKDVCGFEGFYRVSNTGLVASCDRPGGNGRRKIKGRVLRHWIGKCGQPVVDFMIDGFRKRFLVSRLVANAFVRPLADSEEVAHLDLNKQNNHAANLEPMSHKEVMALTNKTLCDFEYIDRERMTKEKAAEYLEYLNGDLLWKRRPALRVEIGSKAGFGNGERRQVHFCGNTYEYSRIVYLLHFGVMPDYVLPKNGDFKDCRIENLYQCNASQWATISNRVKNFDLETNIHILDV